MRHFHDILGRRAALSPHRTALVDAASGARLTYLDLDARAERAAAFLSEHVGRGDRVAVISLNRHEVVEVLFACAKIGAVFVPLNYRLGRPELAAIVEDASPSLVLADDEHAGLELPSMVPIAHAFRDDPAPAAVEVQASDPWILCYTGGTTGTPKGAILTHSTVLWNAMNTITGWGLREDDVASVFTPLYHTGGLNVLMTPLVYMGGASVLVASFDPDLAFDLIDRHRMTYVFLVPSMYRMMMASRRWRDARFETVREFVTGGAPCPRDVYEAFAAKGKRFRMGYGLTEAGPNNFHTDPDLGLHGSVGRPLPFVEARVEIEGREAGPGEVGELLLRGPHVFSGYWGRPEETRAVLSAGWLRTGDLATRDHDGNHAIVGRRKEMFISGGENVYPAEIEAALMEHEAVADAAVVGVPDAKWGEVGLAAVVLRPGCAASADALTLFLRDRIARYKVPRRFVVVPDLPRTGAGKVDKKQIARIYL